MRHASGARICSADRCGEIAAWERTGLMVSWHTTRAARSRCRWLLVCLWYYCVARRHATPLRASTSPTVFTVVGRSARLCRAVPRAQVEPHSITCPPPPRVGRPTVCAAVKAPPTPFCMEHGGVFSGVRRGGIWSTAIAPLCRQNVKLTIERLRCTNCTSVHGHDFQNFLDVGFLHYLEILYCPLCYWIIHEDAIGGIFCAVPETICTLSEWEMSWTFLLSLGPILWYTFDRRGRAALRADNMLDLAALPFLRHGGPPALARGACLWKCCKVFYALAVTVKRSEDHLFMHYFHNFSHQKRKSWLRLWICPFLEKFMRAPMFWGAPSSGYLRVVVPDCIRKLKRTRRSSVLQHIFSISDMLLRFKTRTTLRATGVENQSQISDFLAPYKIFGRWAKCVTATLKRNNCDVNFSHSCSAV